MSDLFLKNTNKNNKYSSITESSFNVDKIINTNNNINKNTSYSVTSSAMINNNMQFSATSVNMAGGNSNANFNGKADPNEIMQLISMLTTENNPEQQGGFFFGNSSVSTENTVQLGDKLKNMLNNYNGGFTETLSTEALEYKVNNLGKQNGGSLSTVAGLTAAGIAGLLVGANYPQKILEDETDISESLSDILQSKPVQSVKSYFKSKKSSLPVIEENKPVEVTTKPVVSTKQEVPVKPSKPESSVFMTSENQEVKPISVTTTDIQPNVNVDLSATSDNLKTELQEQAGGGETPAHLKVFLDVNKAVREITKLKKVGEVSKVAKAVREEIKKENPNISNDNLVKEVKVRLQKNASKYIKMAK